MQDTRLLLFITVTANKATATILNLKPKSPKIPVDAMPTLFNRYLHILRL